MAADQPTVLVVEDEPAQREVLAYNLEAEGFAVSRAETGDEALLLVEEDKPDIIVLDHYLPDMEGLDLLNRISNDVRTSEVPVMILSTRGDLDDVQKAFHAGADEYLVVPYDPAVLEAKVERLALANTEAATEQ